MYKEEKAAGSFEVRRPRTTKEVAVHNNQLMQNMPQLVAAYIMQNNQQQQQQGGVSAWCQQMQSKPQAPRPSAEEQEQQAAEMLEHLMQRAKQLDDEGIGGCFHGLEACGARSIWFPALPTLVCSWYSRANLVLQHCQAFHLCYSWHCMDIYAVIYTPHICSLSVLPEASTPCCALLPCRAKG